MTSVCLLATCMEVSCHFELGDMRNSFWVSQLGQDFDYHTGHSPFPASHLVSILLRIQLPDKLPQLNTLLIEVSQSLPFNCLSGLLLAPNTDTLSDFCTSSLFLNFFGVIPKVGDGLEFVASERIRIHPDINEYKRYIIIGCFLSVASFGTFTTSI